MKKRLMSWVMSLGEMFDWLSADPVIRSVMPSELYDAYDQHR
ncbi:MAG: hypothetical protein AAF921_09170 [Cyanobacteria bacterium P01_D01_bin.44]